MKIAIVCYPTYGGSGVVATELGISLSEKGHEVHFITYQQPVRLNTLKYNIHFHEVHVPRYPLFHFQPYELALSSTLVDMVKLFDIDILHVHYAIPHAYAAYMSKQMLLEQGINIPIITTLHGSDITLVGNHPFYKPAVTFSINNSDVVTCVSKSLKEDTLRLFDIKKKVHVVPNFIKTEKYNVIRQNCDRNLIAKENERIITHVSNFRPVKRVTDVIKTFKNIHDQIPCKLMMVGDGPDRQEAEVLSQQLNIDHDVVFFGKTLEVDKILCFSDLFLLPSQTESFGLAALEAMIARTPVISTNKGGLPEVNIHGVSGYLTEIGDIAEMSRYSLDILKNQEVLKKFKDGAFETAKKFDLNKIISIYENLYLKALQLINS